MNKPTLEEVLQVMEFKQYPVFTNGNYNMNLVGVRTDDTANNTLILLNDVDSLRLVRT